MVDLCDQLIELKKKNKNILMTTKLLETMRDLYSEDKRTWKCEALNQFLVVDHLGRIGGCHNRGFTASIFDLPTKWNSPEFKKLKETYHECTECTYLCYILYSIHGSPSGYISLAKDQWRNAKFLFK
jgi:hypothetical protein